jgi:dTDP-4-dehydrorhamnose reductase
VPNIVIIGESGQLAQSLRRLAWPRGYVLEFFGRRRLFSPDVATAMRADLILNAAAYTAVDRAQSDAAEAKSLNADLPASLAAICAARAIPLVHVSTDYVFDGEKRTPYLETDAPNPLSIYGATKLDGDREVEQARLQHWAILRASWVISEIGETFPVKILRRARQGEAVRVVDDQRSCPTAARDLAHAMQQIGQRLLDRDPAATGLFNFCGATPMTWHGLAEALLAAAEQAGVPRVPLQAISSAALNAPARRPAYSILSCGHIRRQCDIAQPEIDIQIERIVRAILARS